MYKIIIIFIIIITYGKMGYIKNNHVAKPHGLVYSGGFRAAGQATHAAEPLCHSWIPREAKHNSTLPGLCSEKYGFL